MPSPIQASVHGKAKSRAGVKTGLRGWTGPVPRCSPLFRFQMPAARGDAVPENSRYRTFRVPVEPVKRQLGAKF